MNTVHILAAVLSVCSLSAFAERMPIWPEGKMPDCQPHQVAAMYGEVERAGFKPDEHRQPYLDWFAAPEKPNGTCMILVSGGGYTRCCDGWLVELWRERFTALGCQCVNLVYRTPRPEGLPIYQSAWEDGQRAVRLVRAAAKSRGFDPERIGAIGMSAGAHLVTLLAVSSQTPAYPAVDGLDAEVSAHLNWAMTGAIAYALTDGLESPNMREGDGPDIGLSAAFKFDAKTCPMCMFHGSADTVSPLASTRVYRELRKRKVPAELHLFADRPHNFWGLKPDLETSTAYDNWFGRASEFLTQLGFLGPLEKEVELMSRFPSEVPLVGHVKRNVWPEGLMPNVMTNQCTPCLEWFVPSNLTTRAIQIIYSGGGYGGNGTEGFEVCPARRFLNAKGMAVVTLRYRTPRPYGGLQKHVTAWQDLQRTIRIVRSEAASRGLDPNRIGIMGSSAGGHLTLMGATSSRHRAYRPIDELDRLPCNVQWAVGIYPAYALTDGDEWFNKTGGNDDTARLVPEFSFDPDTCPMVFIHGDADVWAAMNSVKTWEQLRRMGIGSDLHTLALRPHCFQRKASPGTGSYSWLGRIWEFMNHKGFNR